MCCVLRHSIYLKARVCVCFDPCVPHGLPNYKMRRKSCDNDNGLPDSLTCPEAAAAVVATCAAGGASAGKVCADPGLVPGRGDMLGDPETSSVALAAAATSSLSAVGDGCAIASSATTAVRGCVPQRRRLMRDGLRGVLLWAERSDLDALGLRAALPLVLAWDELSRELGLSWPGRDVLVELEEVEGCEPAARAAL